MHTRWGEGGPLSEPWILGRAELAGVCRDLAVLIEVLQANLQLQHSSLLCAELLMLDGGGRCRRVGTTLGVQSLLAGATGLVLQLPAPDDDGEW